MCFKFLYVLPCESVCIYPASQYMYSVYEPQVQWTSFCIPGCNAHFQVLIFAEKKQDVDAIHEYLLLKGVEAVAIHGGKGIQQNISLWPTLNNVLILWYSNLLIKISPI